MAGRPPARVGCPVEMFENLSPKVPGHQRAEGAGGKVADEVQVADLLCDDAQPWAMAGQKRFPCQVPRGESWGYLRVRR